MSMEFFLYLESLFTLIFSLLVSFLLANLFSVVYDDDDLNKKKIQRNFKESETKIGFVSTIVDELVDRSTETIVLDSKTSECDHQNENSEIDHEEEDDEDDDDDWEGIERSELERVFGAAVGYVGSISNAGDRKLSLGRDLKLQLYGLHKIATEGPCLVPQPNPLKVSARAKWNAWQQLGDISPEVAMEQYINLLWNNIPEWKGHDFEHDLAASKWQQGGVILEEAAASMSLAN
ncbi:acyl-CoA-binding domain-containing protein 1-like isoform X2 [Mercurialis annua]|uniref:acyl-CoA-binding domain-containing protein 1-like isoform X2 n=1 Tax=Mercurialis annua TaxID=3986 RepID=UPI002160C5BB|nr:acyl-CoA-binding domain-containing protein 1-like isoform X2 [Mercurialis annua]